jgi:hypothetical protein
METVNNFICEAYKSVDIKDGRPEFGMQQPDGAAKGSAVLLRG